VLDGRPATESGVLGVGVATPVTIRRAVPGRVGPIARTLLLFASVGAGAGAVGVLSVASPIWAIGSVVAAAAIVLIAVDVRMLPPFLVVAVFAEGVSVGGLNIGRIIGPLALAAVAYYLLSGGRSDLRVNWLLAVSVALGFWILVSVYWTADTHFAFVWVFRWALSFGFAVAFAVIVREERHVGWVLSAFVVAALVFGIVGLLTYVTSGGLARGSGLTGDPNQFATYEALAVPAVLVSARIWRGAHRQFALYAALALIVLAIGASYSRGGVVTLGAVIIGTLLVSWRVFFSAARQKGVYMITLVFVGWLALLLGSTAYQHRIETIFTGQDRGSGRTDLWAAAWTGYKEQPYLGLGGGGFESRSLDLLHATPGVNIAASYVAAGRPVHNAYLESLVDLGPLGLALFLAVVGLTISYIVRAAQRFRAVGAEQLWRMSICLAVELAGLTMAMIFLSIELGHMLWIFVGLALALDAMSKRELGAAKAASDRPRQLSEVAGAGART
jgi:O-antigen ligase